MTDSRKAMLLILCFHLAATVWAQTPDDTSAREDPLRLSVMFTWDLGLRVGLEYRPLEHLGVVAELGSTLFSLEGAFALTYDLLLAYYVLPAESRLAANLCVGIPDGRFVFAQPTAGEIAFGASAHIGYRITSGTEVFVRAGAGVPFFFGDDESLHHDPTAFPLGLWPDLGIGARFSL